MFLDFSPVNIFSGKAFPFFEISFSTRGTGRKPAWPISHNHATYFDLLSYNSYGFVNSGNILMTNKRTLYQSLFTKVYFSLNYKFLNLDALLIMNVFMLVFSTRFKKIKSN